VAALGGLSDDAVLGAADGAPRSGEPLAFDEAEMLATMGTA